MGNWKEGRKFLHHKHLQTKLENLHFQPYKIWNFHTNTINVVDKRGWQITTWIIWWMTKMCKKYKQYINFCNCMCVGKIVCALCRWKIATFRCCAMWVTWTKYESSSFPLSFPWTIFFMDWKIYFLHVKNSNEFVTWFFIHHIKSSSCTRRVLW